MTVAPPEIATHCPLDNVKPETQDVHCPFTILLQFGIVTVVVLVELDEVDDEVHNPVELDNWKPDLHAKQEVVDKLAQFGSKNTQRADPVDTLKLALH
jgi:hypothetical protein